MREQTKQLADSSFKVVHRWSALVAFLTFPLIWLGGLVTTHDAGMAVPDWPGTYGYNLFLYPWTAWLYGPFDLFVEHGHRLLASLVGLLSICLCVVAYRNEQRPWVRYACYWLLVAIISQGVLGGIRVLLDARTAAMIHGCSGPLVFALGCFIAIATSKDWTDAQPHRLTPSLNGISLSLVIVSILQLFIGAQLRHAQPFWMPSLFTAIVHSHLLIATFISLAIFGVAWFVRMPKNRDCRPIRLPADCLLFVVIAQVLLGIATWVANYATPWVELTPWLARYTLQGKGLWESMIVTGHQATGSLLIVNALWLYCRIAVRLSRSIKAVPKSDSTRVSDSSSDMPVIGHHS